jgi:hypothetical protein
MFGTPTFFVFLIKNITFQDFRFPQGVKIFEIAQQMGLGRLDLVGKNLI